MRAPRASPSAKKTPLTFARASADTSSSVVPFSGVGPSSKLKRNVRSGSSKPVISESSNVSISVVRAGKSAARRSCSWW
jgi:hypothetical protein